MRSKQLSALLCVAIQATGFAQTLTLAQRVAQANENIELVIYSDGPRVALPRMLASTDIVVRGVIGEGVSQFTPDGQSITTTYTIANPTVLFSAKPTQVTRPGVVPRALTITLPGGTMPVGRLSATVRYANIIELKPGMNIIALLQDRGEKYIPAAGAGIFEMRQGRVAALASRPGAHEKFIGMAADDFANQIVAMRKDAIKK
jgi:hypothetical protein